MCGIFGVLSEQKNGGSSAVPSLIAQSLQRGRDSGGYVAFIDETFVIKKADYGVDKLVKTHPPRDFNFLMGHSRLITNGLRDNQPVAYDDMCVIHNGIITNHEVIFSKFGVERKFEIDTEALLAIASYGLKSGFSLEDIGDLILKECKGVVCAALLFRKQGKLMLVSNNGSLYVSDTQSGVVFASERYTLENAGIKQAEQLIGECRIYDIPSSNRNFEIQEINERKENLIPPLVFSPSESKLLEYKDAGLKRCTKCILPETMPFIKFDPEGVCNYCHNYKLRNVPKPKSELFDLVERFRRQGLERDCIVPFSGGRDSCYGLHLIVKELGMKPITYTYDWGMVTDLGRRNISRMCQELQVENIIVAADIAKKRRNIQMNLTAWLKHPDLGMMSILTAGDKHFFRHVETVKKQTGITLNLWGVNPLEVTHFKTGFLDIPPDFHGEKVYTHGALKQLDYQFRRFKLMAKSPGYFNSSLWDTLSGEYYRSFTEKSDYHHIFDYWHWDEELVDSTLDSYSWERAVDTTTTWRIGDGTAAFYNYVYYTAAGFSEHDTFRSNQIREGALTREVALEMVEKENQPRYENIKWYLDAVGVDFYDAIKVVNNMPKVY